MLDVSESEGVKGLCLGSRVSWWAPRPGAQTDASQPAWLVTRSHFLYYQTLG